MKYEVDFGESVKMIKISEKVNKSGTYNGFSNISFFIHRTSSDFRVSDSSTFLLILIIYIYIYIYIGRVDTAVWMHYLDAN